MKPLFPFLKLFKKQLSWVILGAFLAITTLLAGLGLLSLAGWFISAAAFVSVSYALAIAFNFYLPAGGVRLLSFARIISRYGERLVTHQATFKLLTTIRVWFYKQLEPLAPAHLLQFKSSDLLTRLVSDVDALENLYIRIIIPTIAALVMALIGFIFFSFFNLEIAFCSIILLVLSGFFIPVVVSYISRKSSADLVELQTTLKTETTDYCQGLAELILFKQNDDYLEKLAETNDQFVNVQQKLSIFTGFGAALLNFMLWMTLLLAVWLAVGFVASGKLNGAFIALFALGIMALFESIAPLPTAYQYLAKTLASAKRLLHVIEQQPTVSFVEVAYRQISNPVIKFDDVSFSYKNRLPVFKNFSLTIAAGEKLAIAGMTGVGKSTLIQLIARFWDVDEGVISIGDTNIKDIPEQQLRELMTFIPQSPHIFNDTIRNNLLIANQQASDEILYFALRQVELESFVKALPNGLNTWAGEQGKRLSGGQQKRLALARAILRDSPILILDEPTEGLDNITQQKVIRALDQIMHNRTVIIISHKLSILNKMDRILDLDKH